MSTEAQKGSTASPTLGQKRLYQRILIRNKYPYPDKVTVRTDPQRAVETLQKIVGYHFQKAQEAAAEIGLLAEGEHPWQQEE